MIDLSQVQVGTLVFYWQPHMELAEYGLVSSMHEVPNYIHVEFAGETGAKACHPENLYFKPPKPSSESNNSQDAPVIDSVNHPQHYCSHPTGIECIDIVEHMSFNIGNAIKYLWRADHKEALLEDLEKAIWYIRREIERKKQGF